VIIFLYSINWLVFKRVRKNCENRLLASSCVCIRLSVWNSSAPTQRIFIKFRILIFFQNLSRQFMFHQNLTRKTGTLHEDQYTFLIISRSFLHRMRSVSDKFVEKT